MPHTVEPQIVPGSEEAQLAELRRLLVRRSGANEPRGTHQIRLPDSLYRLLTKIVQDLADGKAVSLTPAAQEMTTQKAADFLGVSRQFLVRLLDDGKIAFHRVGTHRRVQLQDLITFRKQRDLRRHDAIARLAHEAVSDGIYDEFWLPRKTSSEIVAVLDACVLFPASLRDTLLRLAETPRQYISKWSDRIIEELTRNLQRRHQLDPRKTDHLAQQLRLHFPEAFILDYEKRIAEMTNHPKDRHVLAAAVQSGAGIIVTFNLRDFPASSLAPRGVEAWHPDDFLIDILNRFSEMVIPKLRDQAATIGRDLPTLLRTLRIGVPRFAADVAAKLNLDIS